MGHIPSGEVRAYVGNSPKVRENGGNQVDIVTSNRSSGSILKPALYALMQYSGDILPKTLLSDIPSRFGGYVPSNFNKEFQGVVPADQALAMSLNIPFVRLLRRYGVEHFYDNLKRMGITTLYREPAHYGLSLILGGPSVLYGIYVIYTGEWLLSCIIIMRMTVAIIPASSLDCICGRIDLRYRKREGVRY